jgi:hypothetical protein
MKAVYRAGAELGLDLIEGWKQIEYKFVARFSRFDGRFESRIHHNIAHPMPDFIYL